MSRFFEIRKRLQTGKSGLLRIIFLSSLFLLVPACDDDDNDDAFVAILDPDGDGLRLSEERSLGTDPYDSDSDDDGLADGFEDRNRNGTIEGAETNPMLPDTDNDGLCDGPLTDNDDDGPDVSLPDDPDLVGCSGAESILGTDPNSSDTDMDGLLDGEEEANRNNLVDENETSPLRADTDDDGLCDGAVTVGVCEGNEVAAGTNPLDRDTDDDGLDDGNEDIDGGELAEGETSPLDPDSDDDGRCDGQRVDNEGDGLWPLDECVWWFYVNDDASGSSDGLSWENAFTAISQAIDLAVGDVDIWVAQGLYTAGENEYVVKMKEGVSVFGGFVGTETALEQRSLNPALVILDGGNVVDHVLLGASDAVLDTLTLQNGGTDKPGVEGGGIYNYLVNNFTMRNLLIKNNLAINGGGIANIFSTVSMNNLVVFENNADIGGGIYNSLSELSLSDVVVMGNSATFFGGGISNSGSVVDLRDATISFNNAELGAGIYSSFSTTTGVNVAITGNVASTGGGGIYGLASDLISFSQSSFRNNQGLVSGGGIYAESTDVALSNVAFWGNAALSGGDVFSEQVGVIQISNSCAQQDLDVDFDGGNGFFTGLVQGATVLNTDPFENTTGGGEVLLTAGSGCENLGDNDIADASIPGWQSTGTQQEEESPGEWVLLSETEVDGAGSELVDLGVHYSATAPIITSFAVDIREINWTVNANVDNCILANDSETEFLFLSAAELAAGVREQINRGNTVLTLVCFSLDGQIAAATATVPTTWYVDSRAGPFQNGTSWSSAFRTIQEGINASSPGEWVWVRGGDYRRATSKTEYVFKMKEGVSVYGGFGQQALLTSDREGITLVNGTGALKGVIEGASNAYLNQMVVLKGKATTGSLCPDACGGAMYNDSVSGLVLEGITFYENEAKSGGAIYNFNSEIEMHDVTFFSNTADDGGAIYNEASNPLMVNTTFSGNTANADGGAVYNMGASAAEFYHTTFSNNRAADEGGAIYNDASNPVMINSVLWGNLGTGVDWFNNSGAPIIDSVCSRQDIDADIDGGDGPGAGNITNSFVVLRSPFEKASGNGFVFLNPDALDTSCIDSGDNTVADNTIGSGKWESQTTSIDFQTETELDGAGTEQVDLGRHHDSGFVSVNSFAMRSAKPLGLEAEDNLFWEVSGAAYCVIYSLNKTQNLHLDPDLIEYIAGSIAASYDSNDEVLLVCGNGVNEPSLSKVVMRNIFYVDPASSRDLAGFTWETASGNINGAMARVDDYDWVFVAGGQYSSTVPDSKRTLAMRRNVSIFGGFAPGEIYLGNGMDVPGGRSRVSILNGNGLAFHVVEGASNAWLDNFLILNGNADGNSGCLQDCGAGMYNINTTNLKLSNLIFFNNAAATGGAIYNASPAASGLSIFIENSQFIDNQANVIGGNSNSGKGGAIFNKGANEVKVEILNSLFTMNQAEDGAAIYNDNIDLVNSRLGILGTSFEGNVATGLGGGIHNNAVVEEGFPELSHVAMWNNPDSSSTGDIYTSNGVAPTVSFSCFEQDLVSYLGGGNVTNSILAAINPFESPTYASNERYLDEVNAAGTCIDNGDNITADEIFGIEKWRETTTRSDYASEAVTNGAGAEMLDISVHYNQTGPVINTFVVDATDATWTTTDTSHCLLTSDSDILVDSILAPELASSNLSHGRSSGAMIILSCAGNGALTLASGIVP